MIGKLYSTFLSLYKQITALEAEDMQWLKTGIKANAYTVNVFALALILSGILCLLGLNGCAARSKAPPETVSPAAKRVQEKSSTPTETTAPAANRMQEKSSTPTETASQPADSTEEKTRTPKTQPTTETDLPTLANLPEGWSQITPGGMTSCARGGIYTFFVRKTQSAKLLIYFEGGGSCYDANTCRVGGNYFDDSIDPSQQADNPALKREGVFALDDKRNPFKDYNMVFVSYCTGDAFLGKNVVSYGSGKEAFQVNHFGAENARTVLNWTYQNYTDPESVFVIGCSAGVVGSFFHAPSILQNYAQQPVVMVGDSGGGYLDGPASVAQNFGVNELLPDWIEGYQDLVGKQWIRTDLFFKLPALAYPEQRFALVDTLDDHVQAEILQRARGNKTLGEVIEANLNDIRSAAPGFLSYNGAGDQHCISMAPIFPNYESGGVKLKDWLAALANGKEVPNVAP